MNIKNILKFKKKKQKNSKIIFLVFFMDIENGLNLKIIGEVQCTIQKVKNSERERKRNQSAQYKLYYLGITEGC